MAKKKSDAAAEEKQKEPARSSEVSKLQVMELVQFMARPLKELERQFQAHCEGYEMQMARFKGAFEAQAGVKEELGAQLEALKVEIAKAASAGVKGQNEAIKYQDLPGRVSHVESQMDGVLEQAQIGGEVRIQQKKNASELERLEKSIKGNSQHVEKLELYHKDVEHQLKARLESLEMGFKDLVMDQRSLKDMMGDLESELANDLMVANDSQRAQMASMADGMAQFRNQVNAQIEAIKLDVRQEMQGAVDASRSAANKVSEQLGRFSDECDSMSVAKKNIHTMERRLDKLVSVVKELRAQFEWEN